jgi:peroxiredoxin Q/BCP
MTATFLSILLGAAPLHVGDKAPDFTLNDTDGHPVTLSRLLGQGPVILAFFPKAFTPGCTRELTSYQQRYGEVEAKGATLVAVSTDDSATQKRFKESVKAPYQLLSDPDGKIASQYGGTIPVVNVVKPLAKRVTFVIDGSGTVQQIVTGNDAVDPAAAISSCPMRKKS